MKQIKSKLRAIAIASALAVAALVPVACGGDSSSSDSGGQASSTSSAATSSAGTSTLPQGGESVNLNPADFTTKIDNPYWPMSPGSRWVYREGPMKVVVTVTDQTKRIADGVEARVVHDVVTENGQPVEITTDWYAQDADGNIWYMGERTAEYENGQVASRAGSFEAGVDGAQPGVALPADPKVGLSYRQEYYKGQAEDQGRVLSLDQKATVPFGKFQGLLETADTTPLEPKVLEHKYYAKGVGPLLTVSVTGGGSNEELISYSKG